VKAVDLKTRHVTLVGPQGNAFTLNVPPEVRNLPQVKPGNTVVARYHASVVFVLAAPGTQLPADTLSVGGERVRPGQIPHVCRNETLAFSAAKRLTGDARRDYRS
jgi:hypothetical protein